MRTLEEVVDRAIALSLYSSLADETDSAILEHTFARLLPRFTAAEKTTMSHFNHDGALAVRASWQVESSLVLAWAASLVPSLRATDGELANPLFNRVMADRTRDEIVARGWLRSSGEMRSQAEAPREALAGYRKRGVCLTSNPQAGAFSYYAVLCQVHAFEWLLATDPTWRDPFDESV